MEGRVIEYRPSHGGGLDYHNSPLIGEIPTTDLYHVHRSIDQLRSLNERTTGLNNLSELKTSPSSSSSTPAIHLEYKLYTNSNGHNNNNNNVCANNNNQHHQQHQQQNHHHENVDYLKHVGDDIVSNGVVTDVSALIDEQNDKIDSVLKHVEKHEVDSVYHPSSMSPSPPPAAITDGRGRKKGSKKVMKNIQLIKTVFSIKFYFLLFLAFGHFHLRIKKIKKYFSRTKNEVFRCVMNMIMNCVDDFYL